ncbi:MAG TPA: 4-(cytidine 5'-diphospho)-2-C-methyl-D-erythritol kinase [Candidatus Binataceae bacterium]|nr:4-(cytidine 5'-diphospho)-2-C-methyl-D-erythritol kinase [Candidatus Binataceae bacterium]
MVKLLAETASAKINLFLRVVGRRPDGYHELDSIFVPVSLGDCVAVEMRPGPESKVTLQCDVPSIAYADTNLASRAARAFMSEFGISARVLVRLTKRIPVGAGLGGGSSDAGAVLRILAALSRIDIRDDRLAKIAVSLGADVPFFLDPRPSRVRGIGERIEPLATFAKLNLVIAAPDVEVPTGAIFKALAPGDFSGPASEDDIVAILSGEFGQHQIVNDLARAAIERYPAIGELKNGLEKAGAKVASMTGSGGAVFGIFRDGDESVRAAESIREAYPQASIFAVSSL